MAKPKSKRPTQGVIQEKLGELLTQQTSSILQAMDDGFAAQDKKIEKRFIAQSIALSATMDMQLAQLEKRFIEKLDRLTTTLDRFLKRVMSRMSNRNLSS